MENSLIVLILAAGESKRMKSNHSKVCMKVAGKPMIDWVLNTSLSLEPKSIGVVLGHKMEEVKKTIKEFPVETFVQKKLLGTADAVKSAKSLLERFQDGDVLILYGDVPLISKDTLMNLITKHLEENNSVTILSAQVDDPEGYGRIIRDKQGKFLRIVEEADTTEKEKTITETNSGIYVFRVKKLLKALTEIKNDNAQGEYYLTDVVSLIKGKMGILEIFDPYEVIGINTRAQLAKANEYVRGRINEEFMHNGVEIIDPKNTYIDVDVKIGKDTVIYPMTFITSDTVVGKECSIGPNTLIDRCKISDNVQIRYSVCESAIISEGVSVGPFSHLRPGADLRKDVKIGNFVEVKKSVLSEGTKAGHLSYLGDSTVGKKVNVGAGTITCNYDGIRKNKTFIGDNAFIGSNTALVAPVSIGRGSLIGAGSVITKDVPENTLALGRARQINKVGWVKHENKEEEQNDR